MSMAAHPGYNTTIVQVDDGEPYEVYSFAAHQRFPMPTSFRWPNLDDPDGPDGSPRVEIVIEGRMLTDWKKVVVWRHDGRQMIYRPDFMHPWEPDSIAGHCSEVKDEAVRCLAKGADAGDLAALAALIDRLLELGREETTVLLRRAIDEQMRRPKPPVSTGMLRRSIT